MNTIKQVIYKITHPFFKLYWNIVKPRTYGARGIILHEDNILLTKNINAQHWSLPGGKIDGDELAETCLFRELYEELGISVSKVEYKLGEYFSNKEGKRDTVYVFVIKLQSSEFEKQWELQDARWFAMSHLPDNTSPATLRRIKEFRSKKKNLISLW